jgi:hypothetical protein
VTHHSRQAIAVDSDRDGLQRADSGAPLLFCSDFDRFPEGADQRMFLIAARVEEPVDCQDSTRLNIW